MKKQHAKAVSEATRDTARGNPGPEARIRGIRIVYAPAYVPHPLGAAYGPVDMAYLAGHRDMNTTKRYVHLQEQTILAAMEKARVVKGGHSSGHTELRLPAANCSQPAVKN